MRAGMGQWQRLHGLRQGHWGLAVGDGRCLDGGGCDGTAGRRALRSECLIRRDATAYRLGCRLLGVKWQRIGMDVMSRLLLCLVVSVALPSCTSTQTVRRVCSGRVYTPVVVRHVQREYGEAELDVARRVLETEDETACWGQAGLVVAVLTGDEAFALLRDRVEAMARLSEREIRYPVAIDLLLAVGMAARYSRDDASKAAIVEYLVPLVEPAWWMARIPGSDTRSVATHRSNTPWPR